MILKGKAWKFGDNINTDEIIPAKYLNTTNLDELAKHCFEGIDKDFAKKVKKGDFIVAGENFGCGSSREHAPLSIKGCGVSCIIAETFAEIFFRNSINIGLPFLECKFTDEIKNGDEIEVHLLKGEILNLTSGKKYNTSPFPDFLKEIIESGGLIEWVRKTGGFRKRLKDKR